MIKIQFAAARRFKRGLCLCGALLIALSLALCPGADALADGEARVIRVGWYDTGNGDQPGSATGAHGYDYTYLQALAQYTGWTYEYVPGTWEECLDRLSAGEIDLLGFVQKTPEREGIYGFPKLPMGVTNGWLVTSEENPSESDDPAALNGITVGIVDGNAYNRDLEQYCLDHGIEVVYKPYGTISEISPALAAGEIDAAVVADEDLTKNERCLVRLASENQYFATPVADTGLLLELDKAMNEVNTYCPYLASDLYQKYFSVGLEGKPIFTAAEQAFIRDHPNVLVLYDSGWPPVEYYDEAKGDYVGISPAIFKLLSEKCGITFVYEGSTSGQVLSELAGEDAKNTLTTISYDYSWAEQHSVYITQPFITSSIVKLGGNVNAENPTVAINEKAYFTYLLKDELAGKNTRHFAKQSERLEAVRKGEADYTYVTEDQANYYTAIPKYSNLEVQKLVGYEQGICISTAKNSDPELLSILSKSLASISHDEMTAIVMENTVNSYDKTLGDVLYEFRVPLAIILALTVLVIASLSMLSVSRRKSREKLQNAYEQERAALQKAEKASEAKGSFMSRMSHEIRTPLNAVIGYNTIARNEMTEAKTDAERRQAEMKVMDCLTKSAIASKHLLTIINDVLDMSAIESGKIKIAEDRFDFKGLISSLTTVFYSQAEAKGVEFEVMLKTLTEEWFIGDQMRVSQILTNLLSNAIKFTPEGGSVKLVIRQPEAEENAAHIHFEVSDTGIGMTKEYLTHLFTPFEQADSSISRRFGGTGLGLSITKNLVDLMGGTIAVASEPGRGTRFDVDLTFGRTEQPENADTYDFSRVNALVVDDDSGTCDYIKLLFNRCGARCASVTSGSEAVDAFALAKGKNEPYSVCLVDWRMPRMDGIETIRRIRAIAGNEIPIIVITAYDFSEIVDKAAEVGVNMFIAKPLFQSSLFNLLASITGLPVPGKSEKAANLDFAGSRVLLVEDNAMNMEIAKKILESAHLVVDSAWNGQEAVEIFEKSAAGTYRTILMDVQMPVMDGHQAARAIRASAHPDAKTVPIIAMTADAFAENVAEAKNSGMNGHIAKPVDIDAMFELLKQFLS